jgi:flavin-binding protein dodecin
LLNINIKKMSVIKVVQILSNSPKSWEDATSKGIEKVSKTIKNIKSAFVQSTSVSVNDGKVVDFRVNLKISFEVD